MTFGRDAATVSAPNNSIVTVCRVRNTGDTKQFRKALNDFGPSCTSLSVNIGAKGGKCRVPVSGGPGVFGPDSACPLVQCGGGTNGWDGNVGDTRAYYNVEHIYDKARVKIDQHHKENARSFANFVMAW